MLAAFLAALHAPYLTLPFHWDELGQFVPAALDLYRDGSWVAHSTLPNVHPPAVMALLALVWRVFGFSIAAARLAMLAVAAAGAFFSCLLAKRLGAPLIATLFLLATPLFYMQSMMALLDMPAMTLTVLALLLFLEQRWAWCAAACTLLVLTKETALTTPVVFAAWLWFRERRRREAVYFVAPAAALAFWLIVLHRATGSWTGNSGFAQYNVTEALHPMAILYSALERGLFLFVKDGRFLGIIALYAGWRLLRGPVWAVAGLVAAAQLLLVTILGGAVLDRYLLPILPILYAAIAAAARAHSHIWRSASHAALIAALLLGFFFNPPFPFQYEDNLAMVDFVDLQRDAARYLESNASTQRIASMWPFTGAIENPDFGYLSRPLHAVSVDSFDLAALSALDRRAFDFLVVYTRQYPMEGTWLDIAPLHPWLQGLPGYRPQATHDELAARGFVSVARWQQRGQWIEIYAP
jgi:4-amino-4-deoxy-L-arabinose transferase-like glycosyltransferase